MQINPFGFPLGAGMQPAPIFGGANLGFADALGLATGGSLPQVPMALGAPAAIPTAPAAAQPFELALNGAAPSAQPQMPALAPPQAMLQTPSLPSQAASALPSLQQPTSLSQLMATAAKLPAVEQAPASDAPLGDPLPAEADVQIATAEPAVPVLPKPPAATATPPATAAASPANDVAPAITDEIAALPEAQPQPRAAKPEPATPARKGARPPVAAEAEAVQPDAPAKAGMPAEMLAALAVQQQATVSAPREAAPATHAVPSTAATRKLAAIGTPVDASAPPAATAAATSDFARAVTARSDSAGPDSNAEGKDQPEAIFALGSKTESAGPAMPQPSHVAAAAHTSPAAARAAAAEPVIEARAGHLGQSLGVEIARKIDLGEETLRVRLNPVELGRVEVTLAFDDAGGLQATVRAESRHALDLLRQDAPDLQRTLDQAGVRTDAQSFRFESRTGDGGGQQAQQQSQNRGRFASNDEDDTAEAVYRPVLADGQVDLLA